MIKIYGYNRINIYQYIRTNKHETNKQSLLIYVLQRAQLDNLGYYMSEIFMISDQWGQIGWMTIQRIKFITTTKLIVGHFIIILYITAKKAN